MQQIKERAGVEEREENIPEENDNGLDMDEDMMLAGLTMFETDFLEGLKYIEDCFEMRDRRKQLMSQE